MTLTSSLKDKLFKRDMNKVSSMTMPHKRDTRCKEPMLIQEMLTLVKPFLEDRINISQDLTSSLVTSILILSRDKMILMFNALFASLTLPMM